MGFATIKIISYINQKTIYETKLRFYIRGNLLYLFDLNHIWFNVLYMRQKAIVCTH